MMKKIFQAAVLAFAMAVNVASPALSQTVKSGTLQGVSVKWTTGSVKIVKDGNGHAIKLGSNFKTKKGPALYVYLGNEKPEKRIGKLKSISGAQSYAISGKTDIGKYSRVFIYCVPFKAVFGAGRIR
jgi:hypothetical protein